MCVCVRERKSVRERKCERERESMCACVSHSSLSFSNGQSTKQQFGMTFTVRPGAKQPITPVIKDGSS